ncbi:MAG: septation protein SepH [Actinomycetota bacterium]
MRDLHVLGITDDGQHLILAESVEAGAQFRIPVDGRLRSAVRGHLDDALLEMRPGAELTPREIQARIRAGETVAELARLSGLPEARVANFAHPVLAERANAVSDARAARVPDSNSTMGDLVDGRLADQGVVEADWDAWRGADGRWAVQLVYRAYDRLHSASWVWDPQSRRVTATDAPAQSLLRGVPVGEPGGPALAGSSVVFGIATTSPVRSVPDLEPEAEQPELPLPEPPGPRAMPARPPGRSGRRASIPSWTQIRETAGIPSNSGDAE